MVDGRNLSSQRIGGPCPHSLAFHFRAHWPKSLFLCLRTFSLLLCWNINISPHPATLYLWKRKAWSLRGKKKLEENWSPSILVLFVIRLANSGIFYTGSEIPHGINHWEWWKAWELPHYWLSSLHCLIFGLSFLHLPNKYCTWVFVLGSDGVSWGSQTEMGTIISLLSSLIFIWANITTLKSWEAYHLLEHINVFPSLSCSPLFSLMSYWSIN